MSAERRQHRLEWLPEHKACSQERLAWPRAIQVFSKIESQCPEKAGVEREIRKG